MAVITIYLHDEDGDLILLDGTPTAIGTIDTAAASWEDLLDSLTESAILEGMRLAKPIKGNLQTFDIVGSDGDLLLYVNKQQLIGQFQTMETAVGCIAGIYARRGGWILGHILPRPV